MSPLARLLCLLVTGYRRLISPFLPATCRYQPTCSAYAMDAVRRHGGLKGGWLALRRVFRCHPWGGYGYDPVPDPASDAGTDVGTGAEPVAARPHPRSAE
ncbi:hypothetical protein EV659_103300 [Rhodothalassium salexigens DSM 2132]|uniref:Putative membrane protein insertion efficiency factor n=1 Tax=Rhodothalassium salexigens DSM 2132 TaxID=1188247 RepID=A0A4R2PLC0_RHOSA|nr:membrane protein insertion efficiency factor YidD [Rhodothalassium salexigens]MBB4210933.1 hypothetical protein [Rhodothalassium salexigens DSM 2132]MBK1639462.1 membrane protein insertion efficiency factor YidD [Rhodothalassium salexigens DSM 2132]TCP36409.1 hypothetical protein EV659_103300 [Rhodothalassium salexigens DSM 2132]